MAFSTDTSIDFSTATGYTLSDTAISGGNLQLQSMFEGVGTCQTIEVDTTSFFSINRVEVAQIEGIDYKIKFLCSFDNGTTWEVNVAGYWQEVDSAFISTLGMSRQQLESVRFWDNVTDNISFLISIERDDSANTGNVSQITIYYIPTSTRESASVYQEPAASGTLEANLGIQPSYPIDIAYKWNTESITFEGNYSQAVTSETAPRRTYSGKFEGLSKSDSDTVVAFMTAHEDIPFTWENAPLTEGTSAFYSSIEPAVDQIGAGIYSVEFSFTEKL